MQNQTLTRREENPVQILRRRSAEAKAEVWPAIEKGALRPISDDEVVVPLELAAPPALPAPGDPVSRRQGLRLMKGA